MGESGDKKITIEEIADQIGQIPAAVMCMVTKRIPFIYKKNGEIINTVDYLLEL
jgi:alanine racemase